MELNPRSFAGALWILGILLLVESFQRFFLEIKEIGHPNNVDKQTSRRVELGDHAAIDAAGGGGGGGGGEIVATRPDLFTPTSDYPIAHLDPASFRNKTGGWIGNHWIPPRGWREFSVLEMQRLYQQRGTLWVGDSTARRAAMTLYGILAHANATDEAVIPVNRLDGGQTIDVNKRVRTEACPKYDNIAEIPVPICRPMPGGSNNTDKLFSVYSSNCNGDLEEFLLKELTRNRTFSVTHEYELIVIAQGIWEAVRPWDCRKRDGDGRSSLNQVLESALDLLEQLCLERPDLIVVWRTSGFHAEGMHNNIIYQLNNRVMDRIEQFAAQRQKEGQPTNLFYVNWGGAIEPRSFHNDRILGDLRPHYGLPARYVLLQMMANLLDAVHPTILGGSSFTS